MDKQLIKDAINEVLEERRSMDVETHFQHHEYIRTLIEKHKAFDETVSHVTRQILVWLSIITLVLVGTAIWDFLTHKLHQV